MSKVYRFLDYELILNDGILVTNENENENTDVILVVIVDNYSTKEKLEEIEKKVKNDIRDFLLDLLDIANFKGIFLPLVLIIKTENVKFWEKIAGDQDWHRGEFYIIPVSKDNKRKLGEIKNVVLKEFSHYSVEVNKITTDEVRKFLENKKQTLDKFTDLEKKYYKLLIDEAIETLKKETKGESFFEKWKNKVERDLEEIINEGEKHE
ncbi:MAG: hypothetical protein PWP54_814 [Thermosipho sp. (in: thermotogales)]|nr:hypothetical protein [Thermosipho sp. (in: thermotogales)]